MGGDGSEDGRYIDERLGLLEGEGAQQRVESPRDREAGAPFEVWSQKPSEASQQRSYYERPVLKEPVWIWSVPAYFYAGGVCGAAAVLGAIAQAVDGRGLRRLVRRCRWISAVGGAAGTALLIIDLGRPERFLNMLRVFRPTSPLNVGSWVLATTTPLSSGAAMLARANGNLGRLGDLAGFGAGISGVPMSGYTAVLLSTTAIPVWQSARRTLPWLFVASAASSASALLEATDLDDREHRIAESFGRLAGATEIVAAVAVEREVGSVERVARPLREGLSGALWKTSLVCGAGGLVLSLAPGKSRLMRQLSSVLTTAGALTMRFAVFHAGKASARDPHATFEMQRRGHGGAEVTGHAAIAESATKPERS
jgi:formate-dependent nitrite reductase membrane component NrfD